jgi:hypothetical protein
MAQVQSSTPLSCANSGAIIASIANQRRPKAESQPATKVKGEAILDGRELIRKRRPA